MDEQRAVAQRERRRAITSYQVTAGAERTSTQPRRWLAYATVESGPKDDTVEFRMTAEGKAASAGPALRRALDKAIRAFELQRSRRMTLAAEERSRG